jgi:excisionase family DNA binding protein
MGIERQMRHLALHSFLKPSCSKKLTIARVAQVIGVHPATVSRLMDSGKLGYYQIGTRRIVGQTHLEQYLLLAERKARVTAVH